MNEAKKRKAVELLDSLNDALKAGPCSGMVGDAQEAIADVIKVLTNDAASYKASDYAVARAHAKISRLVGFKSLKLSDQAREAWRNFKDFVYGDAHDNLRGVGGMNLG